MSILPNPLVIGFTGPFGSGCSTSARILAERLGFKTIKLSDVIRADWERKNGHAPTRKQLQEHGDSLRRPPSNAACLAQQAIEAIESDEDQYKSVAIDGIRNVSEIDFLRKRFGHRFYLFALECPASERWERLKPDYEGRGQTFDDFNADDKRDKDEEVPWGQQVQLCVDRSDVLLINDDEVTQVKLRNKLLQFVRLMTGETPRYATPAEILMNLAYSASHGSKCLKRQVGAVLVDAAPGQMGDVVGTGFNENPPQTHPCVEEPTYGADPKKRVRGSCYRDVVRFEALKKYAREGVRCTGCGQPLTEPTNGEPPCDLPPVIRPA